MPAWDSDAQLAFIWVSKHVDQGLKVTLLWFFVIWKSKSRVPVPRVPCWVTGQPARRQEPPLLSPQSEVGVGKGSNRMVFFSCTRFLVSNTALISQYEDRRGRNLNGLAFLANWLEVLRVWNYSLARMSLLYIFFSIRNSDQAFSLPWEAFPT